MSKSSLTLVAAVAVVLAVPAAGAQARSLKVDKRCYHVGDAMVATGGGFARGEQLMLTGAFQPATPVTAERGGAFKVVLNPAVPARRGARGPSNILHGRLTATNPRHRKHTASASYLAVDYAFDNGSNPNPRAHRAWYFSGFRPNAIVYGHFRKGNRSFTHRFGKAKGSCGMLHARAAGLPIPRSALRSGRWEMQVDTRKSDKPHSPDAVEKAINVSARYVK